jgi:membrane fusion protein, multidrug efflux system
VNDSAVGMNGRRVGTRLLFLGFCAAAAACGKSAPPPPPPAEVVVAKVLQKDLPIYVEAIGQTRGSVEVEVRARVEGFLQTVDFREGSVVHKGDLLYTIDPSNLEAALAQANGQLARARAEKARSAQDVARYKPLVAQNAVSRQVYDTAVSADAAADAAVDAAAATAKNAEINLSYAKIYAPADGLIGKTDVKPGNLVGRGQNTLLTTISNVNPINIRFSISERDYLKYTRSATARPESKLNQRFELVLADGLTLPDRGDLTFADNTVDPATGTLLMEATFPNPSLLVRPGQYGRVRIAVDTKRGAILVPQRAVKELQATYTVAVVSREGIVAMRTVKTGERVGSLWEIVSGLAPDDMVVVEGLQKVRDGVTVKSTTTTISDAPAEPAPAAGTAAPAAPAAAKE